MSPRRPARRERDRRLIHAVQMLRLEGVAAGRLEPLVPREEFYLRLLRMGRRPDPADFIVSRALFHLEEMLFRSEDATGRAAASQIADDPPAPAGP